MRSRTTGAVLGLSVALALVTGALVSVDRSSAQPALAVAALRTTTSVTASSTADRTSAQRLAAGSGRGVAWRSNNQGVGVTLTTRYSRPIKVDGTRILGAGSGLRIGEAWLQFSDGSDLAVTTDRSGSRTVSFAARTVSWVRLTVVSTAPGQKSVGLAGWRLHETTRGSDGKPSSKAVSPASVATSSGSVRGTAWLAGRAGPGQWMRITLPRSMEVAAIRISGGARTAATTTVTGYLRFSDGSRIGVGSLEAGGGAPTTVAFMPRVTREVTFVATEVAGGGSAAVRSLTVFPTGVTPPVPAVRSPTYRSSSTPSRSCVGVRASGAVPDLRLLCPSNGSAVGASLDLVVAGPAGAALTVTALRPWNSAGTIDVVASGTVGADGTGRLRVPTSRLLHGPAAVRVTAAGVVQPLTVQFDNRSGIPQTEQVSPVTRGMNLVYNETFDTPLSATRTGSGATYATGKPNWYGVDDFGEAIFSTPTKTNSSMSTIPGGYLRIRTRPLGPGETDGGGFGRRVDGGLISSAHLGGSGFTAQYGYFEARMLAPAGPGTWPAFWLLSAGNLPHGGSGAETDVVELYGAASESTYQTSHSWINRVDELERGYVGRTADWSLMWHTYGARIEPTGTTYYVDGVPVFRTPPAAHQHEPFFFLANLALTKGWDVGLAPTGHRVDLYIDSIRVWV